MERKTKQKVAILVILTLFGSFVGAIPARADSIAFGDVTQSVSGQQVSLLTTQSGASVKPSTSLTATGSAQTPSGATQVETIQLGDIDGTVCNCGEMRTPGGFPLPLLGFAAVPLLFIRRHHNTPPEVFPTPTPTPTPIPEPTTLLLLGSGLFALGAGARRRANRQQLNG